MGSSVTFRSAIKPKVNTLGFANTAAMFRHAHDNRYAVGAYNINDSNQVAAYLEGCAKTNAPVILQVSKGAREFANARILVRMAQGGVEMVRNDFGSQIPIALHLDHGDTYEVAVSCIESGFSSVMIDGSAHRFEDNVELTTRVVEYAHKYDVSVEGELGVLSGIEDDVEAAKNIYTDPEKVIEFVRQTGADSLAISIGTSHGAAKFKPGQCTRTPDGVLVPPRLRFDILEEIEGQIPGFPIVLHGASSVVVRFVEMINAHGGALKDAVGIPEDQLREAARLGVDKINIDTDGRLAYTALVRKTLAEQPTKFDPRGYLKPARAALTELIMHKNTKVLGSANQGDAVAALYRDAV